jgi:hypothetical protein
VDIALTAPEGSIADAVAGGSLRVVAGLIDRPPLSMIALPRHRTFGDLRGAGSGHRPCWKAPGTSPSGCSPRMA